MLAIRLQRVGHKAHAMYRVIVQEAKRQPTSGRLIAHLGSYDPHTKECKVNVEVAQKYLDNGAQPSPRLVKLLSGAGVVMPKWVKKPVVNKIKAIKNTEKLRKNQPKEVVTETAEQIAE